MSYRPLPIGLTIGKSYIDGLGLIAKSNFDLGHSFGITHIWLDNGQVVRTPLGGFINHSDKPNCKITECEPERTRVVHSIKDIKKGEELTVKYQLYNISHITKP